MPYLAIVILGAGAGISSYAGVTHLLIGLARRPRDRTHLLFALLALSAAGYTLAVLGLHTAASVADYVVILKYVWAPTALTSILSLMWFVGFYTGIRPRGFLLAMSLWFVLILILHLSLPFGILYAEISGLRQISLPWGEQIVIARGTPNPLRLAVDLFYLTLLAFFCYTLARQYRGGNRRTAVVLGLALGLFLVARVVDTLVQLQVIESIFTIELAFVGIVISMSLTLSYEVTRTELELHTYQQHLHDLVAARTAELTHANAELAQAAEDNTRLYQRALAARERLSVLYQAAQAISRASLDPEQIYAEIHRAAARLMPAEALVIALYDQPNQDVDYVYLADVEGRWPGGRSPLASSFAGYMLCRNASVRIDDFSVFPQTEFAFEQFGEQPNTESGLAVLLRGSEQVLGLLFVQSYAKGAYTDEDEELLKLLAAHAAIALENARHSQQARELAASQERTRLARDLHDSVTQTLFSASLLSEALPTIWRQNATAGERDVGILRQLVRGALAEMRTLLFELRPAALAAADLGTLLRQLGDALTGRTRIQVELTIEGAAQLPADTKIELYRIAQEAFNNIAKHAGATQVWVTLRVADSQLFLSVRDDGRGFDPASVAGDHLGTRIMAERAAAIGGCLRIDSAPQRGTEISVTWPAAA